MKIMIRILVIESFVEREDRKQVWEREKNNFTSEIQIQFCRQQKHNGFLCNNNGTPFSFKVKDEEYYDIVFIHSSDSQFSPSENYIDAAQEKKIPYVCYSGGTIAITAPNLDNCQIDEIALESMQKNLEPFLRKLDQDQTVTKEAFYILVGFNPKLNSALEILQLFLPLDIHLQLNDSKKCQNIAKEFENQKAIDWLEKAIGVRNESLDKLLTQIDNIKTNDNPCSLFGDFHQTYITLRDELLEAAESK